MRTRGEHKDNAHNKSSKTRARNKNAKTHVHSVAILAQSSHIYNFTVLQMGFWPLEDVGILQYILDFLLYHDPIIEPYNPRKCVGHGELVFAYERETYRAVKWHPRNHFGRCPNRSCGCKARMWRIDESCPECYTALILKSASHLLKRATRVNAWRTTTCRCGECQDSWIKAGWICPIRWGNEWMDAVEMNAWWELPVSLAIAHKTTST